MREEALNIIRDPSQAPDIRLDAILYIVDRFEPEHLPIFEDILNNPKDHPDVRSAIALSLGKIGGEAAMSLLLKHAHSEDLMLKEYVLQALGMLGKPEVVPVLVEALKDPNNKIFASAADALGRVGRPAMPHLIQLLSEGADDARCVAAWKLGELNHRDAVPALLALIEGTENIDCIALAIWALGEIGMSTKEVMATLEKAKRHSEPEVYLRADLAMKKIARHTN